MNPCSGNFSTRNNGKTLRLDWQSVRGGKLTEHETVYLEPSEVIDKFCEIFGLDIVNVPDKPADLGEL